MLFLKLLLVTLIQSSLVSTHSLAWSLIASQTCADSELLTRKLGEELSKQLIGALKSSKFSLPNLTCQLLIVIIWSIETMFFLTRGCAIDDTDWIILLNEHRLAGQKYDFVVKKGLIFCLLNFLRMQESHNCRWCARHDFSEDLAYWQHHGSQPESWWCLPTWPKHSSEPCEGTVVAGSPKFFEDTADWFRWASGLYLSQPTVTMVASFATARIGNPFLLMLKTPKQDRRLDPYSFWALLDIWLWEQRIVHYCTYLTGYILIETESIATYITNVCSRLSSLQNCWWLMSIVLYSILF